MCNDLENQFRDELLESCRICQNELRYRPTYFLRMLGEQGALEAARQLVNTPVPSEGFSRLWELGRLDLSVEAHVIREEYGLLFTPEEIERARARLNEYDYEQNP